MVAACALAVGTWVAWPSVWRPSGPNDGVPSAQTAVGDRTGGEDRGEDGATDVEVAVVSQTTLPLTLSATGRTAPSRDVEVSSGSSGAVSSVGYREGARVVEGAVLFRIDDRVLQIELADARAALLKAQARYAGEVALAPEPTEGQGGAAVESARVAYERVQDEARRGGRSPGDVARARRQYEAALLLTGDRALDVRAARTGVIEGELRVERARLALDRTVVRAPFSGRVAELKTDVGQYVGEGSPLLRVVSMDPLWVRVDGLQTDAAGVEVGAAATVRVPALGRAFRGRVRAVNPQIDPDTRAVGIIVEVAGAGAGEVVAGLFCEVEVEVESLDGVRVVPEAAVVVRQGREVIFRVAGGVASWVYVTPGPSSGGYVVVEDGVAVGDTVAVGGHFALADGAAVRVRPPGP